MPVGIGFRVTPSGNLFTVEPLGLFYIAATRYRREDVTSTSQLIILNKEFNVMMVITPSIMLHVGAYPTYVLGNVLTRICFRYPVVRIMRT